MGRHRSRSREDRHRRDQKSDRSKKRRYRSSSRSSTTSSTSSDKSSSSGSSRKRKESSKSTRRRSRSRSHDRSRSRRSRSRSYDRTRSREKHRSDNDKREKSSTTRKNIEPTISLETKVKEESNDSVLTVEEQINRIQAVKQIQSDGFVPQSFSSSRNQKTRSGVKSETEISNEDNAATMGILDKGGICHPSLFVNHAEKEDRWLKKLFEMRQQILRENPSI